MKIIIVIVSLLLAFNVLAAEDTYQFDMPEQRTQFDKVTQDLRCVVCQNQSIAESNAPLAVDLRGQVYQQVLEGKTKPEIIGYMVERYGDFVVFKPPFQLNTTILWFTPFFLLVFGLLGVLLFVSRQRRTSV